MDWEYLEKEQSQRIKINELLIMRGDIIDKNIFSLLKKTEELRKNLSETQNELQKAIDERTRLTQERIDFSYGTKK